MWVICIACHHAVELKPMPKGNLYCSACGSRVARKVRQIKESMLNGGQMPAETARILTHAALISVANHRGYKRGWAAMRYKTIYGKWPDGDDPEPQNPSGELMWWIKREGKVYAKMMREKDGGEWKPRGRPSKINPTGNVKQESALMSKDDWEVDL